MWCPMLILLILWPRNDQREGERKIYAQRLGLVYGWGDRVVNNSTVTL